MEQAVVRRLLLSKEFFLHALGRSEVPGALNKMIAVHNFHIAIEITLRAIMLHHHIRTEKTLNLEFETMLSEIDNHLPFKQSNQKLPYRQELRSLNQLRNLVQHHAVEPESATMEDWRVFTKRFLVRAFVEYFSTDFDALSRISFVEDALLRTLLERSAALLSEGDTELALCVLAATFEYASLSILSFLPHEGFNSAFFLTSSLRHSGYDRDLTEAFDKTYQRIRESEHLSAIMASGVSLASLKRFETLAPGVTMAMGGHAWFNKKHDQQYARDSAAWVHDFVTDSIISWQNQGLDPRVPEYFREGASKLVDGSWPVVQPGR